LKLTFVRFGVDEIGWVTVTFSLPTYIIPHSYSIVKFLAECFVTELGASVVIKRGLCYGFWKWCVTLEMA
jgi:hypothetical protein